jgi:hypothetical protein
MLLTRLGFELLAGHTLQRWLGRFVQRRLDDFKRPRWGLIGGNVIVTELPFS